MRKEHNIITFVEEYCKCRKIPYSINGYSLIINNVRIILSMFTYKDIIDVIDKKCEYDNDGYFVKLSE